MTCHSAGKKKRRAARKALLNLAGTWFLSKLSLPPTNPAMTHDPNGKPRHRLNSWKEVSAFFGKSESTVKRWEAERGLPIHRLPGDARSGVYADVGELETWLKNEMAAADSPVNNVPATRTSAQPKRRIWLWGGLAAVFTVIAALTAVAAWPLLRLVKPVPPEARALYLDGVKNWQARTPASLNRAVDDFNQAIRLDPDYAQAYAGLANCYNLLPEYTAMPTGQGYTLARTAARRAIQLDDRIASAHAALAFADFFGFWDSAGARREYERALALDPDDANVEHWYATFLMTSGDTAQAMTHIDRALALNPDSISIQADRGMIQFYRDPAAAIATLTALEKIHPEFRSPHSELSFIYLMEGDNPAFIREATEAARLGGDANTAVEVQAAAKGLAGGGRQGMLRAMLDLELDHFEHGTAGAYSLATLYGLQGDQANAVNYLKLAIDRHESNAIYALNANEFAAFRNNPALHDQLARLHP